MAKLIYKTDFEDIVKIDPNHLSLPIPNWFEFGTSPAGTAAMWVEGLERNSGITPHSGSRCIGMEVLSGGERVEFILMDIQNIASPEYYVSAWLYLPVGWQIPLSHWYSMGQPFQGRGSPWLPTSEIHPNNWDGDNSVDTDYDTPPNLVTLASVHNYLPPVERWFKFEYYVYMHPTQGKLKVWIDGNLMCDVSDLQTVNAVGQAMSMMPAKIYGSEGVGTWRLWVDDLEIWDGMPAPISPLRKVLPVLAPILIGGVSLSIRRRG